MSQIGVMLRVTKGTMGVNMEMQTRQRQDVRKEYFGVGQRLVSLVPRQAPGGALQHRAARQAHGATASSLAARSASDKASIRSPRSPSIICSSL